MLRRSKIKYSLVEPARKETRFDEENLRKTHHPIEKDYGLMPINESKTPFPRREDPVDAARLRQRLKEALELANRASSSFSLQTHFSPMSGEISPTDMFVPKETFAEKRKRFYQAEYKIAQQQSLSDEIHSPGEGLQFVRPDVMVRYSSAQFHNPTMDSVHSIVFK